MIEKVLPYCFVDSVLFTNFPNKMWDSTTAVGDSLITRIGTPVSDSLTSEFGLFVFIQPSQRKADDS